MERCLGILELYFGNFEGFGFGIREVGIGILESREGVVFSRG